MNRVFALRSGKSVTLNINGAYNQLVLDTEEEAVEMFKKALEVKNDPTDENILEFLNYTNPSFRVMESGILEKDRIGNFFLKGYNIPMPATLVARIREYSKEGYPLTALENFWKLCMLNPDDRAREDLFTFADQFHFPITDSGYFIAYKSVAGINMKHRDYALFIAREYLEMKSAMKQDPKDFTVVSLGEDFPEYRAIKSDEIEAWITEMMMACNEDYYDGPECDDPDCDCDSEKLDPNTNPYCEYEQSVTWLMENRKMEWLNVRNNLDEEEVVNFAKSLGFTPVAPIDLWKEDKAFKALGTLDELFNQLNDLFEQEELSFTDWHTKKMSIKLGQVVQMERKSCDTDPHNTCSYGLHVGAPKYVTDFCRNDNQFILAVLVNPAHVIAVPKDYSFQKMRVCEYYPYALCEVGDNGHLKELETPYFEANYCGYEKAQLEQQLIETQRTLHENTDLSEEEQERLQEETNLIVNRLFLIGDAAIAPATAEEPQTDVTF